MLCMLAALTGLGLITLSDHERPAVGCLHMMRLRLRLSRMEWPAHLAMSGALLLLAVWTVIVRAAFR